MSKHTPGPWSAKDWRVCSGIDIDGNLIPGRTCSVICDTANNKASRTSENKANAKLIAAAPELLEALRDLALLVKESDYVRLRISPQFDRAKQLLERLDG